MWVPQSHNFSLLYINFQYYNRSWLPSLIYKHCMSNPYRNHNFSQRDSMPNCNKQRTAYFLFSSSPVDFALFPSFLNFATPSIIPTTRSEQTIPATSPPRKDPTVTALLLSTVAMDSSPALGAIDGHTRLNRTDVQY